MKSNGIKIDKINADYHAGIISYSDAISLLEPIAKRLTKNSRIKKVYLPEKMLKA